MPAIKTRKKKVYVSESESDTDDTESDKDDNSAESETNNPQSDNLDSDNLDSESGVTCEIIYECDDVAVTNISNFWIHVLTKDQWDIILNNFENKKFYVSAFNFSNITTGDILIIYQNSESPSKPGGFVGLCEVSSDMTRNDGSLDPNNKKNPSGIIRVYDDGNMNRYVSRISTVMVFEDPIKISLLADIINNTESEFGTIKKFRAAIKGDCIFAQIYSPDFGLEIVKKLHEISNNQIEEKSKARSQAESESQNSKDMDKGDDVENKEDNTENNTENQTDDNTEDNTENQTDDNTEDNTENQTDDNTEDNTDSVDSDLESDSDLTNSNNSNVSENRYMIKNNIPIMMVLCKPVVNKILRLNKSKEIVKIVYDHYVNCEECDITNNNTRELSVSVKNIGIHNIKYVADDYTDVLVSYLSDQTYPPKISDNNEDNNEDNNDNNNDNDNDNNDNDNNKDENSIRPIDHHVTFYHIKKDQDYYDCFLIDFTSKLKDFKSHTTQKTKTKNIKTTKTMKKSPKVSPKSSSISSSKSSSKSSISSKSSSKSSISSKSSSKSSSKLPPKKSKIVGKITRCDDIMEKSVDSKIKSIPKVGTKKIPVNSAISKSNISKSNISKSIPEKSTLIKGSIKQSSKNSVKSTSNKSLTKVVPKKNGT